MKNRRVITAIASALGMLILILDAKTALAGAKEGMNLCIQTVIPSLFPFFVISSLVTSSLYGMKVPIFSRLFPVPEGAESLLIPGFLGGYPAGAQSIGECFRAGILDRDSAQRMLPWCSNAGPAFLFGMTAGLFQQKSTPWILWGIQIASALCVAWIFPATRGSHGKVPSRTVSPSAAMKSGLYAIAAVCGWVILFRILIGFFTRWALWFFPQWVQVLLCGILELANGCCALIRISDPSLRFILCSGILSFGGLCVAMQTASVAGDLSLRYYFPGKLLQALFSIGFAVCWIKGLWFIPCLAAAILFLSRKSKKVVAIPVPLMYNAGSNQKEALLCCSERK